MNREGRQGLSEDAALRTILEGTATETGERFFAALVRHLAGALGTHGAWVTEFFPEKRRLRALAFWLGDRLVEYEAGIDGTPCEAVITQRRLSREETEAAREAQHQALRWTYLGSGMVHPNFLGTLESIDPALRAKVEAVAPHFS